MTGIVADRVAVGRNRAFAVVVAVLVLAAGELMAFIGVTVFGARIHPRLVWAPNVSRFEEGYGRFVSAHDTLLGWPAEGDPRHDSTGARVLPAYPDGTPCVSLYGDSFTFGAEVSDEAAWGNVLARMIECRVANYGVGGYGTDQAFLRFLSSDPDGSELVILGIFEDNIQRNLNRYRALLAGESELFDFKPRFVGSGDGQLRLVPLRFPEPDEVADFLEEPGRFLENEYFLPGSAAGPIVPAFPFLWTAARIALHPDVRAVLRGRPYWERYYQPGHPSEGLEIMLGLVRAFESEASSRGQQLLVVVFPSPRTLRIMAEGTPTPYRNLTRGASESGTRIVDLSDGLIARLSGRSPCEIATHPEACRGHYNLEGNTWVAEIVYEAASLEGPVQGGTDRPFE